MKQITYIFLLFVSISTFAEPATPQPAPDKGKPGAHKGGTVTGYLNKLDTGAYSCEVANYESNQSSAYTNPIPDFQVPAVSSVGIEDAEPHKVPTGDKKEIEYRMVRKDGKIKLRMTDTKGKISYAETLDGLMLGVQLPGVKQILQCRPPFTATLSLCEKETPVATTSSSKTDYEFQGDVKFSVKPGGPDDADFSGKVDGHKIKDDGGVEMSVHVTRPSGKVVAQFGTKGDVFNVTTDDGGLVSYQLPGRTKAVTAFPPKDGLKAFCESATKGLIGKSTIRPDMAGEMLIMPNRAGAWLEGFKIDPKSAGRRRERIDPTKSGMYQRIERIDPTKAGESSRLIDPTKSGMTETIREIDPTKSGFSIMRSQEPRSAAFAREIEQGLKLIQDYIKGGAGPLSSGWIEKWKAKHPEEFEKLLKDASKK